MVQDFPSKKKQSLRADSLPFTAWVVMIHLLNCFFCSWLNLQKASFPAAFTAGWQRYCFACCTSQPILIGCITLGPGRMFALTYRVLGLGVGCWMSPLLALLCSAVFEDPRPSSLCACSPVRALVKSWCCIGGGQSPTPEPVLENCQ